MILLLVSAATPEGICRWEGQNSCKTPELIFRPHTAGSLQSSSQPWESGALCPLPSLPTMDLGAGPKQPVGKDRCALVGPAIHWCCRPGHAISQIPWELLFHGYYMRPHKMVLGSPLMSTFGCCVQCTENKGQGQPHPPSEIRKRVSK